MMAICIYLSLHTQCHQMILSVGRSFGVVNFGGLHAQNGDFGKLQYVVAGINGTDPCPEATVTSLGSETSWLDHHTVKMCTEKRTIQFFNQQSLKARVCHGMRLNL